MTEDHNKVVQFPPKTLKRQMALSTRRIPPLLISYSFGPIRHYFGFNKVWWLLPLRAGEAQNGLGIDLRDQWMNLHMSAAQPVPPYGCPPLWGS